MLDFLALVLLAAVLLTAVLPALVLLALVLLALVFLAAADLRAAGLFAAVDLAAVDLGAVEVEGADLAAVVVRAEPEVLDFLVAVALLVADRDFVVLDRSAAVLLADCFAVVDLAAVFVRAALFLAEAVWAAVFLATEAFVRDTEPAIVALTSFFSPETTAFSSAPGLNFGTAFFLARIRSPVWGLRTMRAGRTTFSKAPKPVMATFSPFVTSLVTVSRTASSACEAALLLPSKWPDRASIS